MALNSYLQLKGRTQGIIKGSVTQKGREGSIAVFAFTHEIISPRDPASGLATGKRLHQPFVVTKEIDQSSPLLYLAFTNNELLTMWEMKCFATIARGAETNNYKVSLTNATIVDIKNEMLNNKIAGNDKMPMMEEISFVYQKIEWMWVPGGITASDDWETPTV